MEANNVILSLETYNRLRDDNRRLREANKELNAKMDADKVRTIKYIIKSDEYVDGVVEKVIKTKIENFDDVREEVALRYEEQIDTLMEEKAKLSEKNLALEMEISRLRHRSWWKRLLNL